MRNSSARKASRSPDEGKRPCPQTRRSLPVAGDAGFRRRALTRFARSIPPRRRTRHDGAIAQRARHRAATPAASCQGHRPHGRRIAGPALNAVSAAAFTGAGTRREGAERASIKSIGSEGRSPLAGDSARPQSSLATHRPQAGSYPMVTGTRVIVSSLATHRPQAGSYPMVTGTRVIVSLPKISMTFTATT